MAVMLLMPTAAQADPGIRFIPPEAFVAVVVRPADVVGNEALQLAPLELLAAESRAAFGLTPAEVDSILLFAGTSDRGPVPQIGIVVKTNQDYDLKQIGQSFGQFAPQVGAEPGLVEAVHPETEVTYLKSQREDFFSVYPIDERTLLLGLADWLPDYVTQATAEAGIPAGPLRKLIAESPAEPEVQAYLAVQPVQEISKFLLASPEMPPPLKILADLPDHLSDARISFRLRGPEGGMTLVLTGKDEDSGEILKQRVHQLLDLASAAAERMTDPQDPENPSGQAIIQYRERITKLLREALRPEREGPQVTVSTVGKLDGQTQLMIAAVSTALLPAVMQAQNAAQRMRATNDLKQIILAMHNYHATHDELPADIRDEEGRPLLSWRVQILPFIGESDLYDQFRRDEPWDSEHNVKLLPRMPAVLASTQHPESAQEGKTPYLRPSGEEHPGSVQEKLTFADITDGTSGTIAVIEVPQAAAAIWTKPAEGDIDWDNPLPSLINAHPGGFQAAWYDGSVRFISNQVDPQVFKAILTHAGGEVVPQIP